MIQPGLQRISRLLSNIALPWRAIHVAGTNGKGSVCAYISEMLDTYNRSHFREKGGQSALRHGRFTSPHLVDRWDCITFSNDGAAGMEVVKPELFLEVEYAMTKRNEKEGIQASEFELLTATAFTLFAKARLDVAVIETGMGGRQDATNVLGQVIANDSGDARDNVDMRDFRPPSLVTAITKVGLDHQGFLGDTIEAIAREKAGIFKPHVPFVSDQSNQSSVTQVLREVAQSTSSPEFAWQGRLLYPQDRSTEYICSQRQNNEVALAATLAALTSLSRINLATEVDHSEDDAFHDLIAQMSGTSQQVVIPGRLESLDISSLIGIEGNVLVDGAHNEQSAAVLGSAVDRFRSIPQSQDGTSHPVSWVLAASKSKDVEEILRPLLRTGDHVFTVEFGPVAGMPWVEAMDSEKISNAARESVPDLGIVQPYGRDIEAALVAAHKANWHSNPAERKVVVAGSLYLVGELHRLLRFAGKDKN